MERTFSFSSSAHTLSGANIFVLFFSTSAAFWPNLFPVTGVKVIKPGIALDRPDRVNRLRAFPHDRFNIYTLVPIVRIELNSIQATEVVSVVRVVWDRSGSRFLSDHPDRLNIIWHDWDDRDDPNINKTKLVYSTNFCLETRHRRLIIKIIKFATILECKVHCWDKK